MEDILQEPDQVQRAACRIEPAYRTALRRAKDHLRIHQGDPNGNPSAGVILARCALFALLLLAASSPPAWSVVKAEEGLAPRIVGDLWGETTSVAIGPQAVYVAVGARIRALARGEDPALLATGPLIEGRVRDLALQGSRLYAAAGPAGLRVFDVSRPEAIAAIGRVDILGAGAELAQIELLGPDRIAAIVDEAGGRLSRLLVIDAADPSDIRILTDAALGERAEGMVRLGDHLVINRGLAGLSLTELDPATGDLKVIGRLDRRYESLAVAGDRLFAGYELTLHEIDWSEPSDPQILGQPRDRSRKVSALMGAPGRLCAAGEERSGTPSLWCYALSEGEKPSLAVSHELGDSQRAHRQQALVGPAILGIDGDALYLADGAEGLLRVALAAGGTGPRPISSFTANASAIILKGDLAYSASPSAGLEIWDISRQDDARRLWSLPAYANGLDLDGRWLYSLGLNQIEIRDIEDPGIPVLAGAVAVPGLLNQLQARSGWIYAMQRQAVPDGTTIQLVIIDARDPSMPRIVGQHPLDDQEGLLRLQGDRLWFAAYASAELVELDLGDPARPIAVARHSVAEGAVDMQMSDGRLVLLSRSDWQVQVFEIRPDARPRPIGDPIPASSSRHVAVDGDLMALTSGTGAGLRLFDISSLDQVSEFGPWSPEGSPRAPNSDLVSLEGHRALVGFGSGEQTFHALDLSGLPSVGALRVLSAPWDAPVDLATSAGHSYLATGWSGSWIVDSMDRSRPRALGSIAGQWMGSPSKDRPPPQGRVATTREGLLVTRPFDAFDLSDPAHPVEHYRYVAGPSFALGTQTAMAPQTLIDGSLGFVGWHFVYRPQGPEGSSSRGPGMLDLIDLAGPNPPERVGRLDLGDDPVDMVRSKGFLYLAGRARLIVVDARQPRSPAIVAAGSGTYAALAARGDRLWALTEGALEVFDISDPATPRLLGSLPLPALSPQDFEGRLAITQHGLRTYGALPLGEAGLLVLDLDAVPPRQIGWWRPGWPVAAVSLEGRRATVALEHGGLLNLDIDFDRGPVAAPLYLPSVQLSVGQLQAPIAAPGSLDGHRSRNQASAGLIPIDQVGGLTKAVAMSGAISYLGLGHRVIALDISDPAQPKQVARGPILPSRIGHLIFSDGKLYALAERHGLYIIDTESSPSLRLLGQAQLLLPGERFTAFALYGAQVLVGASDGLRLLDVSDPTAPRVIAQNYALTEPDGVAMSASRTVVTQANGLVLLDRESPGLLLETGRISSEAPNRNLVLYGDIVIIGGNNENGLTLIDLGAQPEAELLQTLRLPHEVYALAIQDQRVFATGRGELSVVDLADPRQPQLLDSVSTAGSQYEVDVAVSGDWLSTTDKYAGLALFDLSDPSTLRLTGRFRQFSTANGAAVGRDGLAAVQDFRTGLHLLDASNPSKIDALSLTRSNGGVRVAIRDTLAYVVGTQEGLGIFDISDPELPVALSSQEVSGHRIALDGDHAYMVGGSGLGIVDISDPIQPMLLSQLDRPSGALDLAYREGHVFVAADYMGLIVYDVTDPVLPRQVAVLDLPQDIKAVDIEGNVAYVALENRGWAAIDVSVPAAPLLLTQFDRPRTPLSLAVSQGQLMVSSQEGFVEWFDVSGSGQPRFVDSHENGGYNEEVTLDGNLAFVSASPSGLWVYRLDDGSAAPPTPTARATASATPGPDATISATVSPTGSPAAQAGADLLLLPFLARRR
jgi:hypothetical protein